MFSKRIKTDLNFLCRNKMILFTCQTENTSETKNDKDTDRKNKIKYRDKSHSYIRMTHCGIEHTIFTLLIQSNL